MSAGRSPQDNERIMAQLKREKQQRILDTQRVKREYEQDRQRQRDLRELRAQTVVQPAVQQQQSSYRGSVTVQVRAAATARNGSSCRHTFEQSQSVGELFEWVESNRHQLGIGDAVKFKLHSLPSLIVTQDSVNALLSELHLPPRVSFNVVVAADVMDVEARAEVETDTGAVDAVDVDGEAYRVEVPNENAAAVEPVIDLQDRRQATVNAALHRTASEESDELAVEVPIEAAADVNMDERRQQAIYAVSRRIVTAAMSVDATLPDSAATSPQVTFTVQRLNAMAAEQVAYQIANPRCNMSSARYMTDLVTQLVIQRLASMQQLTRLNLRAFMGVVLTHLDLSNQPLLTDTLIEQLAAQFSVSLKTLSVAACPLLSSGGLMPISQLTKLTSLDLSHTKCTDAVVFRVTCSCKLLEYLNVSACKSLTVASVAYVTQLQQLQLLHLSVCNVARPDLFHLLASVQSLTELSLSKCNKIFGPFSSAQSSKVTALDLSYTAFADQDVHIILDSFRQLRHLNLFATAVTQAQTLIAIMSACQLLKSFIIPHIQDMDAVMAGYCRMRHSTLQLDNSNVSDTGLAHLLQLKTSLTALNLARTRITAASVVNVLSQCVNLRQLTLDHMPLGDGALTRLNQLPQLERLSLVDTLCTDMLWIVWREASHQPRFVHTLRELNLSRNHEVTSDVLRYLLQYSHLEMLNLLGTRVDKELGMRTFSQLAALKTVRYPAVEVAVQAPQGVAMDVDADGD